MKGAKVKGYGPVAVFAVKLFLNSVKTDLESAWVQACIKHGKDTQKGCPKSVFKTLCTNGYIKNIPQSKLVIKGSNSEYTLHIMKNLDFDKTDFSNYESIWRSFSFHKSQNDQISVIHGLYEADLLKI